MTYFTYLIYLMLSTILVGYMGNICVRNGKVYILNYFPEKEQFAYALNNSLRIAYYCLNIGLSVWSLHYIQTIESFSELISEVATRLSFIILILSGFHFFNLVTIYFIYKHFKNHLV